MKQVIKKGKNKEEDNKVYIKKCSHCKCEFIYTKNAVVFGTLFDYIYCPSCDSFLTIIKHKVYKRK